MFRGQVSLKPLRTQIWLCRNTPNRYAGNPFKTALYAFLNPGGTLPMRKIIREMFGEMSLWGKFWLTIGLGTLAAAAAMSWDFGSSVSIKHALFLALLSVVTAFAPEAAYRQWKLGAKGVAIAIAIVCAPLFIIEFYTHAGFTAGLRGHNIVDAKVANVKYAGAQEAVSEDKTNLEMWRKRLAALETEHAWTASVTAEALRAQLANANLAIDLESKRGGCKSKCLARTKERDDIATKIALAEEKADLTGKIEATKRVLAQTREKAATTEYKHSSVDHQNQFLAKAVALISAGSLEPSELTSEAAQQSVNLAMAIAGTGLPAFALFIAGLYRREEDEPHRTNGRPGALEPAPTQMTRTRTRIRDAYERYCRTYGVAPVAA